MSSCEQPFNDPQARLNEAFAADAFACSLSAECLGGIRLGLILAQRAGKMGTPAGMAIPLR